MYNEKLKFQFNENVNNAERFTFLAELFKSLEAQSQKYTELDSGGVPVYKIKHNGQVTMHSFFPSSTEIIKKFVKSKKSENIIK